MPVATVNPEEAVVRKELKSLEGAWVELRPLPFGLVLERRDKATKMSLEQQGRTGRRRRQSAEETQKIAIEMFSTWSRRFDFANCIVDHNLEDHGGRKLNFGSEMDIKMLNPKVAVELERLIDELNGEEDEEDENFLRLVSDSSTPTPTQPS